MKYCVLIVFIFVSLFSCQTPKTLNKSLTEINTKDKDTVRIANDTLEYEIIIIEPGFNFWLESRARPRGYYTQEFFEIRNRLFVTEWNIRALDQLRYDTNLYEQLIDYQPNINYGYEVNYKLYYYFVYFQLKYKQQLTGFIPRI